MKAQTAVPMISERQFYAAGTALLVAGTLILQSAPRAASVVPAFEAAANVDMTIHAGIDWTHVGAAPVETGATVGAYR